MNRKKITKAALSGLVAVTMVPAMAAPLVANAEDKTNEATNNQEKVAGTQNEVNTNDVVQNEAPVEETKTIEVNYAAADGSYFTGYVEVSADAEVVTESQLKDIPEGYVINVNDVAYDDGLFTINDRYVYVPIIKEAEATKVHVTLFFVDEDNQIVDYKTDCSVLAGMRNPAIVEQYMPQGYSLAEVNWINFVEGGEYNIKVKKNEVTTKKVTVSLIDEATKETLFEKTLNVDNDKISFTADELKEYLPDNYEFCYTAEAIMTDSEGNYVVNYLIRQVKTTKEIGVNFWDGENYKQAGEAKVTVSIDANNVKVSEIENLIPKGYELAGYIGDYQINDGWIFVEVKPATTKTVGINFWDVENKKQAGEDEVTVSIDANNVGMSDILDLVPEGYELTGYIGDYQINDGWIFVEVKPAPTTKTIGVNYWDIVNNVQVSEGVVTVDADANNVNTNDLTDVPEGYEIVWVGDTQINDGWIFVELRPVATTKTVGLNYWDVVNNKQVSEGSVVVDSKATSVNTSTFTDVPEGYELVWKGDLPIMDGWVWVEVRPVAEEPEETAPAKLIISFQDENGNEILTDKVQTVVSDIEGTSDEVYTFVYGENYDVVIPEGYTYEGEYPTVDVNFGQSKQIVLTLTKTAQEPTQPGDEEEPNTPAEGTEESEQTDGTDTGVAMSLAGVFGTMSAALAGMVALLRRKQK
mgnify:CR=1 FL=1